MPTFKRRKLRRSQWGDDHFQQLRFGWDYFHGAWGDPCDLQIDDRATWPAADTLEDMRACWQQHGEEIKRLHAQRRPDKPTTWAELVFDRGISPQAAIKFC